MKKKSIILALSFLFFNGISHATNFNDKTINYNFKTQYANNNEVKFPLIVTENESVAKQINTFLHQSLLNTLPPNDPNINKTIELGDIGYSEISMEAMEVINNERVLGITFNLEGCGAYCENYDVRYEFDTRNGRVLTMNELFKADALPKLAKIVNKENTQTIKKFLTQLKKGSKKPTHIKDKLEAEVYVEEQILMYENCLENYNMKSEFSSYKTYPGKMTILNDGVNFAYGRCSNHAMRALDELWEVSHTIKSEELRPYLTEYGKYILLGEGNGDVPVVNPYAQLYKGKINNKIDIILYLGDLKRVNRSEKDYRYSHFDQEKYFYTKYKKGISLGLSNESKNGEYILIEESLNPESQEPKAKFKFKMVGNKLIGQWISKEKTLPFEATPF